MVDLHRPMRANQIPTLRFRKVTPQIVMPLLLPITIELEYSPELASQRKSFGSF
jgi:hypothetical protein